MQAALLNSSGFELVETTRPEPAPRQVVVKTSGCGICGGDHFLYKNKKPELTENILLGHEGSGEVVAVGGDVNEFAPGDRVTALGGAYADYFIAEADDLVLIPESVDSLHALGEPIACCVHAARRFNIEAGDSVAVVGCGFMGLICLQLAKLQGAGRVVAIDPLAYRLQMASKLGADDTCTPDEITIEDPWTGEFNVVIEAAGVQAAVDFSADAVAQHGRIIFIGYHESNAGQRNINLQLWNYKAIDVVNGHVRRDAEKRAAMHEGMAYLRSGELQIEPLVSLYPLSKVQRAFEDFEAVDVELFKVVLVPDALNEANGK